VSRGLAARTVFVLTCLALTVTASPAVAGAAVRAEAPAAVSVTPGSVADHPPLPAARHRKKKHHRRRHRHHKIVLLSSADPRAAAEALLPEWGWSVAGQFPCLDQLWNEESGWDPYAENPDGAYGIPQALPGSKMASAGADWVSSPVTQIRWGLRYIADTYGSPCGAWDHELADGWY
jgi:hypothetical protein